MSLVNDMLRDLEKRRANRDERARLAELTAADEAAAARREKRDRLRRGTLWLSSLVLIGALVGMMIGRLVDDRPLLPARPRPAAVAAPAPVPAPARARVLDVLPQHDGRQFVLQLLLDRSVAYQRIEESGAVSLHLPGVTLDGGSQQGRVQRDGRSLSWRVDAQGDGVQVLLVGLAGQLEVHDRLEPAGDRYQLWLEVPLETDTAAPAAAAAPVVDPPARPPVAAVDRAAAERVDSGQPSVQTLPAAPPPVPVTAPQVSIASHAADPLTEARQALLRQDYPKAIALLEGLVQQRPDDAEAVRWLARAYLAGGQQARLLAWLPAQLQRFPRDAELRVLLARAQLQNGDKQGAVATLRQNPPPLVQDPTYHALLAAAYQQTGQWQQSAELYRQLLALRPQQGAWLLGLAIALDQTGDAAQASRYYRLALQDQALDDSARRFAVERAKLLGGSP